MTSLMGGVHAPAALWHSRTSASVVCHAQPGNARGQRVAAAAVRKQWHSLNSGPPAPQRFQPTSVLPLVSSAVESSAQMATFESFAGRSAMVGFLVALAIEWGTEQSTFAPIAPNQATTLAAILVTSLGAAAALATAAARRPLPLPSSADADAAAAAPEPRAWWWLGARIHEAVMSSLTGAQRSASGVTQHKVDEVVDFVVDRCLTQSVHPVFGPLREAGSTVVEAGSTVVTVMDSLLAEDRPDLPH